MFPALLNIWYARYSCIFSPANSLLGKNTGEHLSLGIGSPGIKPPRFFRSGRPKNCGPWICTWSGSGVDHRPDWGLGSASSAAGAEQLLQGWDDLPQAPPAVVAAAPSVAAEEQLFAQPHAAVVGAAVVLAAVRWRSQISGICFFRSDIDVRCVWYQRLQDDWPAGWPRNNHTINFKMYKAWSYRDIAQQLVAHFHQIIYWKGCPSFACSQSGKTGKQVDSRYPMQWP